MECPSCGRFTGPYPTCPYCGARLQQRTPLRWLKLAALALSVVGLAGLWFAATRVQVPVVQIGQVGGMMNMAYARIEGRVSRGPDYDPQTEALAFWVEDDTGELRVAAYRDASRDLIARGRIPALGDRVSVAGNLRVREDFLALYLNSAEQLQITRPVPEAVEIGSITPLDIGRRVRVSGQVLRVYEPYAGLTLITLRDAGGEIPVAVSQVLGQLTGPLPAITVGQSLQVTATVSLYQDTPQLVPAVSTDLVPLAGAVLAVSQREIGSLGPEDVGQWVQVQGAVVAGDPFSAGIRFTLDDGSGQITMLLWQSLYAQIPYSATIDVGARLQVRGSVAQYRGALEVVPEAPPDVTILVQPAPPEEVQVASLSPADAGRVIALRGVLVSAAPFSKGVRYTLNDGSGEITLLLWSNVAEQAPAGLGTGSKVRVVGSIAEYEGALEIVPRRGSDLQVLGQQALPTPAPPAITAIGQITTADDGRTLTVEGVLEAGEAFSKGMRFPLRDESGTIVLLLWQNVIDAFPGSGKLQAGVRVRITGTISVYQGTIEIAPEAEGIAILE